MILYFQLYNLHVASAIHGLEVSNLNRKCIVITSILEKLKELTIYSFGWNASRICIEKTEFLDERVCRYVAYISPT